jgi:hypothetical protein
VLAIVVVLFCLDRVLLAMERHGWIYYRKCPPAGPAPTSRAGRRSARRRRRAAVL